MLSSYKHIGQNRIHLEEIDSTNVYAMHLISKTTPTDGIVITADYQTAGKGQYDRIWTSERGKNIILSIILHPEWLSAQNQIYLNMAIALGIHDFLSTIDNHFKIKWPNDLYHLHQKIGGILIQNQLQGQVIKNCIIGMGINVNQRIFGIEAGNPTSLSLVTGQTYDIQFLIGQLLEKLNVRYSQLKSGVANDLIRKEFEEKLYGFDQTIWFEGIEIGHRTEGKIIKVDNEGRLCVMTSDGIRALVHGEVKVYYS